MFQISKSVAKSLVTVGLCAALSTTALAAGNGGSPNGKPFVTIDNQIIEVTGAVRSLEDDLVALIGRVDNVEDRITASEFAISDLQGNNAAMVTLIDTNALSVVGINGVITNLQADIADLQGDVATNSGDITDLQGLIAANEALIANLRIAMDLVEAGLVDLETSLQDQIDYNFSLIGTLSDAIADLRDGLDLKQNIVNGICENGEAAIAVAENSITCAVVGGDGGDATVPTVFTTTNFRTIGVPTGGSREIQVQCPAGTRVTGGGFNFPNGGAVQSSRMSGNGWSVKASPFNNGGTLFAYAVCLRLAAPAS